MNPKITKSINKIGIFLGGGIGYHLIDKALSYKAEVKAGLEQQARDEIMIDNLKEAKKIHSFVQEQFHMLNSAVADRSAHQNGLAIPKSELLESVNSMRHNAYSLMNRLSELKIPDWEASAGYNDLKEVIKELDNLKRTIDSEDITNNFISGSSKFFEYLDSLTLLQESSLLHIIIYIVLLTCVINILGVLFGNEIIRYFNLEERFPKLSTFFKLRAKLQRYYLMWNISIMFIFCIGGAGIDLLLYSIR